MGFGKRNASRSSSRQTLLVSADDENQDPGSPAPSSNPPSFSKRLRKGNSRTEHTGDRSSEAVSSSQQTQTRDELAIGDRWRYRRLSSLASNKNEPEEVQERFKRLNSDVQIGLRLMARNGIMSTEGGSTSEEVQTKCGQTMLVKPLVTPENGGVSWKEISWGPEGNGKENMIDDDSRYSPKTTFPSSSRTGVLEACRSDELAELCPDDQLCTADDLIAAGITPAGEARTNAEMAGHLKPGLRSRIRSSGGSDAESNQHENRGQSNTRIMTRIKSIFHNGSGSDVAERRRLHDDRVRKKGERRSGPYKNPDSMLPDYDVPDSPVLTASEEFVFGTFVPGLELPMPSSLPPQQGQSLLGPPTVGSSSLVTPHETQGVKESDRCPQGRVRRSS